jgi:hypothetical protein
MTTARLDSRLAEPAVAGLEPHVPDLYRSPGIRRLAVVELRHVERTQPAPDSDKTASVKLQVTHLELANEHQEPALRDALSALYMLRTAEGTLDQDGQLMLSERTLERTAGEVNAVEAARLHMTVSHWASYTDRVLGAALSPAQLREELKTIRDGLRAAKRGEANA